MSNLAEGTSMPVHTCRSFVGKRFNLPVGSTMFCLNIQHRIVTQNKIVVEITDLANGSQYFCNEVVFQGVAKIQGHDDIVIHYIVDFSTIESSTEVIPK